MDIPFHVRSDGIYVSSAYHAGVKIQVKYSILVEGWLLKSFSMIINLCVDLSHMCTAVYFLINPIIHCEN